MTATSKSTVDITTRWDRPAVATGKGETYLVVTLETGKQRKKVKRSPVDISFVIDRSGSMSGQPLELAKRGVIEALNLLTSGDRFSVVAYDHTVDEVSPLVEANPAHIKRVQRTLVEMHTGGSTNLYGGWQEGCSSLRFGIYGFNRMAPASRRISRTILLSDGLANIGVTDPSEICGRAANERGNGITTSTLGLGTGFDEAMLAGMAEAGGGNFAFVQHPKDLPAFFARELGEALAVVASETTLTLTLPKGIRARLLNPFPVERDGKRLTIAIGDLPAGLTLDLVFVVTTRIKAEGPLPLLELQSRCIDIETGTGTDRAVAIDPIMAISPSDFATMPRDGKVSAVVAEMVASEAKRDAIASFRKGDRAGARKVLSNAKQHVAAAPMARVGLMSEMSELYDADPDSAQFQVQQRQTINDEHRRSRGRDL